MCTIIRVHHYSALDDLQQLVKFVSLKLEVYRYENSRFYLFLPKSTNTNNQTDINLAYACQAMLADVNHA